MYARADQEGGCGVIGFAVSEPVTGGYMYRALRQMHNRGNGKGGGIAAAGCFPEYRDHYALQIGYLDPGCRAHLERERIFPFFQVVEAQIQPSIDDYRDIPGLEIRPPEAWRYFCRVKPEILQEFALKHNFKDLKSAEDEFVFQNSFVVNKDYYADLEDKKAFVLSHGKNIMVLKGVGYAEDLLTYYRLEEFLAYVWIGHQRYPTRGRVWHPGGAHPFVGLNEALVHNGDFANYYAVCEYLKQRGRFPLFLTDTEVSVLLFDYYTRTLGYDLEKTIEALAPTTERDFEKLPKAQQRLYRAIRASHIHGSPDGPWFFIIARSIPQENSFQLVGITDTSMLRPHVFALFEGKMKLGAVSSEKQAIDALAFDLSRDRRDVCSVADLYWVSRGGSHTDGGAFVFTVKEGGQEFICRDKFGKIKRTFSEGEPPACVDLWMDAEIPESMDVEVALDITQKIHQWKYEDLRKHLLWLVDIARKGDNGREFALEVLTRLRDRQYHVGGKRRNWILSWADEAINRLFLDVPLLGSDASVFQRIDFDSRCRVNDASGEGLRLAIDASGFPQEGEDSVSRLIVRAYRRGFLRFYVFRLKGDRFLGCGLGQGSRGVRIDVYGSSGDYLGSGLDGAEIYVHGNAQDQVGQILNSGKIVIFGDVGQTFLYGAKGGEAYVLGNTGGRPLINAVGSIRAVINGTCLDYAAESFMAGEELGGGFLIINGLRVNQYGEFIGLEEKFPGGNFFSLASGGAGYLNDPYRTVEKEQLVGAIFVDFTMDDWKTILPYLQENERLFGVRIERDLLTVDRVRKWPQEVFRKVIAGSEFFLPAHLAPQMLPAHS